MGPDTDASHRPKRRAALWILGGVFSVLAVIGGVFGMAPQIPVLLRTGFPAPVFHPSEPVVSVVGAGLPWGGPTRALPEASRIRFEAKGGRALVVDGPDGRIEVYGPGFDRETLFNSYSLVKSLVGALALRAVADGKIAALDTLLTDHLPGAPAGITLAEALRMTSGLALGDMPLARDPGKPFDDRDYSPVGPMARLHAFGLAEVLAGLRVDPDRRGTFVYQSVNTALVGAVVAQAYGRDLPDLLSELIWRPAGAATAHWRTYPAGDGVSAYCCLYARAVDWMRVARFLMENGTEGAPFLPDSLWRKLILPDLTAEARRRGVYGLHLRHDVLDRSGASVAGPFAYFMGHSGQVVYLLPEQDSVVVRFGAEMQLLHSTLYELWDPS